MTFPSSFSPSRVISARLNEVATVICIKPKGIDAFPQAQTLLAKGQPCYTLGPRDDKRRQLRSGLRIVFSGA